MKKNLSILVVDDSETDRYLLKRLIQKTELIEFIYEVENGQEALDHLEKMLLNSNDEQEVRFPNIIFLDVNMPLLNGFEFLQKYLDFTQENKQFPISNIIMFSSSENEEDRKKALAYDFVNDYMIKGSAGTKEIKNKIEDIFKL